MATNPDVRDLTQQWMRMQRQLFDEWTKQMQNMPDMDARALADQMTATWNRAIETSGEVQREWARALREEIASMNEVSPDAAARISDAADEFAEWTEAQERFWKEWVNMMRQSIPADALSRGQRLAGTMFEVMQKGAQALFDATNEVIDRRRTERKY